MGIYLCDHLALNIDAIRAFRSIIEWRFYLIVIKRAFFVHYLINFYARFYCRDAAPYNSGGGGGGIMGAYLAHGGRRGVYHETLYTQLDFHNHLAKDLWSHYRSITDDGR